MLKAIRTFFREFFGPPELKCERVGHKKRMYFVDGYATPEKAGAVVRCVAVAIKAKVPRCQRCKKILADFKDWEVLEQDCLDGLSMPVNYFDEMNANGYVLPRSHLLSKEKNENQDG